MSDPLSKLFGTSARVKLLRLFLFNSRQSFTLPEAAQRARTTLLETRRELRLFQSVDLIVRGKKGGRYALANDFAYVEALQNLLLNAPTRVEDIVEWVRGIGPVKLVVLSGVFLGEWNDSLDMLIVGDKIQERKIRQRTRRFEAEIGKELRFTILSIEDFLYRLNMNDKLIRDVFDYPHRIVLDRLNIGLK